MSVNILTAISNIVTNQIGELRAFYESRNRANGMGETLEQYIKDIFASTLSEADETQRIERLADTFAYQGNQNNPPDMIIRQGDAIEVKKIENSNSALALNSSYPKAKIFANSPMISRACRNCEEWNEKDILYAVGVVKRNQLSRLFFVYGIDYAASADVYERIRSVIRAGVNSIPNVELTASKELGRVNRVDPLGITYLRIRGMWGIENPAKVFSYVYTPINTDFEFVAIINDEKYNSFPSEDRTALEALVSDSFKITDIRIKTPDNPSNMKDAKLITLNR